MIFTYSSKTCEFLHSDNISLFLKNRCSYLSDSAGLYNQVHTDTDSR